MVLKIKEAVNRAYESSLAEGLLFERREFHCDLRARRPEGGHAGVRREAQAVVPASLMDILVDRPAPGVVRITLNRPEARNALRTQMLAEIAAELAAAANDDAARAVVITGGLACFAAGADLREMAPLGPSRF